MNYHVSVLVIFTWPLLLFAVLIPVELTSFENYNSISLGNYFDKYVLQKLKHRFNYALDSEGQKKHFPKKC